MPRFSLASACLAASLGCPVAVVRAASPEVWGTDCGALGGWQFGLLQEVVTEPALEPRLASRLVRVSRRVTDVVTGEQTVWTRAGEPGLVLCAGDVVETWYDVQAVINRTSPAAALPIGLIYPEGGSTLHLDQRIRQVKGAASYFLFDERPREEAFDLEVFIEQSGLLLSRARSLFRVEVVDEKTGQVRVAVSDQGDGFSPEPVEHGVMLSQPGLYRGSRERWVSAGEVQHALPLTDPEPVLAAASKADQERLGAAAAAVDRVLAGMSSAPPSSAYTPLQREVRLGIPGAERPGSVSIDGQPVPAARWRRVEGDANGAEWELRQPLDLPVGQHWVVLGGGGIPLHLAVAEGVAGALTMPAAGVATSGLPSAANPVALGSTTPRVAREGLWLPVWAAAGASKALGGNTDRVRLELGVSLPGRLRVGGVLSTGWARHQLVPSEPAEVGVLEGSLEAEVTDAMLGLWLEPNPTRRHRKLNWPYIGLLRGGSFRQVYFRDLEVEADPHWFHLWAAELRIPVQPLIRLPVPLARQLVIEPFVHGYLIPQGIEFVDGDTEQPLGSLVPIDVELGLALGFGSPNRARPRRHFWREER